MKLVKIVVTLALALSASAAQAAPILFDYETTAIGSYASLTMTESGLSVTLTRTSGSSFAVASTFAHPAVWGGRDMENFSFGFPLGDAYNGNFSSGVGSVSIQVGDFNADDDTPITLSAYSGLNGVGFLGSSSTSWLGSDSFPSFKTLSVTAPGIQSIRFTGGGPFPNSLFWDNLVADADVNAVPEPASMLLLGSGLLGVVRSRLKKKK